VGRYFTSSKAVFKVAPALASVITFFMTKG
jgi:hypothetical protein